MIGPFNRFAAGLMHIAAELLGQASYRSNQVRLLADLGIHLQNEMQEHACGGHNHGHADITTISSIKVNPWRGECFSWRLVPPRDQADNLLGFARLGPPAHANRHPPGRRRARRLVNDKLDPPFGQGLSGLAGT